MSEAQAELRKALLRSLAGKAPIKLTRKARSNRAATRSGSLGVITSGEVIEDIDHGAWSFIGQPPSPTMRKSRTFDFL